MVIETATGTACGIALTVAGHPMLVTEPPGYTSPQPITSPSYVSSPQRRQLRNTHLCPHRRRASDTYRKANIALWQIDSAWKRGALANYIQKTQNWIEGWFFFLSTCSLHAAVTTIIAAQTTTHRKECNDGKYKKNPCGDNVDNSSVVVGKNPDFILHSL